MGRTKRKYSSFLISYKRRYKQPLLTVSSVMPVNFSDIYFYEEFKVLFSYLWEDLYSKYNEYKRRDDALAKKRFPRKYLFPEPNKFLEEISYSIINKTRVQHLECNFLNEDERLKVREIIFRKCNEKLNRAKDKLLNNLRLIQEVTPDYSNYFINEYFRLKHKNPQDVTSRYILLNEASKYKCKTTIEFLHKINASERNFNLRHFAFLTLQKFDVKEVSLRKNRSGKKRLGDNLVPDKIETPTQLLKHIYISQLEKEKKYDLFLSHSSLDKELILSLKTLLNTLNLNIYVDWINDQESLKRNLTNVDTAEVIIERLKSCKALFFVYTEDSLKSLWTPWEIGYFHSLKGKICIFFSDDLDESKMPAFINIYPKAAISEGALIINDRGKISSISEWLNV